MMKNAEIVSFWMSPEEKEAIRELADKNRRSMSDVLRILVSENIKNPRNDSMLKFV